MATLLLIFLSTAPASLTPEQIGAVMRTDVAGERLSVIPFAAMGGATLLGGGLLLSTDSRIGQGAAWPLLTVGALEVIAGLAFALRAGSQLRRLEGLLASDPKEFARLERHRVQRIRDRFQPILLIAEAAICAGGGAMAIAGAASRRDTLTGVGIGLAIQGLALFLVDWAVLDRARAYAAALDLFRP
jgi:hypothetical protein